MVRVLLTGAKLTTLLAVALASVMKRNCVGEKTRFSGLLRAVAGLPLESFEHWPTAVCWLTRPATSRTQLLPVSAMKRSPRASRAMPEGALRTTLLVTPLQRAGTWVEGAPARTQRLKLDNWWRT